MVAPDPDTALGPEAVGDEGVVVVERDIVLSKVSEVLITLVKIAGLNVHLQNKL